MKTPPTKFDARLLQFIRTIREIQADEPGRYIPVQPTTKPAAK